MSQSAITTAFEDYLAQQLAAGAPVTLDQFVFANVPDLDPDAPIDRGETVPTDYVVHQQDVTLPGVINDNEVVYSVTMGTDVGDFDFNWIGLVNAATGLLGMVTHAPVQQKFKNADGQQGNTLTRSFLMEYDGAATATNITTPAETWQIDFTARLSGMDERQRLENTDVYGDGAFFGNGFLVSGNPTDGYQIAAGSGYVGGLRVQLDAAQSLNVSAKPIQVYVDACWKGTLTSVWTVQQAITLASTLADYTDQDGTAHYVFAVASIDANGAVTDLRPKGSKDGQYAAGCLQIAKNLSEIAAEGTSAQGSARNNLGLKSAAVHDVTTSRTDTTAGHVLQVGDYGLGASNGLPVLTSIFDITCASHYSALGNGSETPTAGMPDDSGNTRYDVYASSVYTNMYWVTLVSSSEFYVGEVDTNNKTKVNWSRFYCTQHKPSASDVGALSISGGTLTGDEDVLRIINKTQGGASYIVGFDKDSSHKWYVGNGSSSNNDVMLNSYIGGNIVSLRDDGSISINTGNSKQVNIAAETYANVFAVSKMPGAGSYVSQYATKAPFYNTFNSSQTSEYHPLWKQRDEHNSGCWSGGIIINAGDFNIQHIDSSGNAVEFTFSKDGQFTPGKWSNFDSRYISNMQLGAETSHNIGGGAIDFNTPGTVLTGFYCDSSNDDIDRLYSKPLQKDVGGKWVTISG